MMISHQINNIYFYFILHKFFYMKSIFNFKKIYNFLKGIGFDKISKKNFNLLLIV
jgi:hypothetical protein